jgi:hypothetical protein
MCFQHIMVYLQSYSPQVKLLDLSRRQIKLTSFGIFTPLKKFVFEKTQKAYALCRHVPCAIMQVATFPSVMDSTGKIQKKFSTVKNVLYCQFQISAENEFMQ